jgi:preprotein translocase subunit YajC
MTNLAFLHLALPAAPGQPNNPLTTFLPLILVFVIFYFFMIRPQMKKQKELNNYRNSLKRGDKVVTTGGIYGKVYEIKDNYITMEVGGDVKLKIDKNAVLKDLTPDA